MSTETTEQQTEPAAESETPVEAIKPPDTIKEKTQAPYNFTVEEIGELGRRLSQSRKNVSRIEAELDSIKQDYKSKLAAVELEQDTLCRKLDDGFEMRDAMAIVTFNDPTKGRKTYRHEESGAFIREEPMTLSDHQLPMFRDANGGDATATEEARRAEAHEKLTPTEFLNSHDGEGTRKDLERVADTTPANTPLGDAIDQAASLSEAPKMQLSLTADWQAGALKREFKKQARAAGWFEAQISLMSGLLDACDNVIDMKDTLRPHTQLPPPASSEVDPTAL